MDDLSRCADWMGGHESLSSLRRQLDRAPVARLERAGLAVSDVHGVNLADRVGAEMKINRVDLYRDTRLAWAVRDAGYVNCKTADAVLVQGNRKAARRVRRALRRRQR